MADIENSKGHKPSPELRPRDAVQAHVFTLPPPARLSPPPELEGVHEPILKEA